jgi:hypothetical protein
MDSTWTAAMSVGGRLAKKKNRYHFCHTANASRLALYFVTAIGVFLHNVRSLIFSASVVKYNLHAVRQKGGEWSTGG